MRLTVITPTANRPEGLARARCYLHRQTCQPDEWIVSDGSQSDPPPPAHAYTLIRNPGPPGAENFARNVLHALLESHGDVIVFVEDDDWYAADHLARLVGLLADNGDAWAAGDDLQRYYNVPARLYRTFDNVGASMCQTAIRREALPLMVETISACLAKGSYGVDTTFWRALPRERWAIRRLNTVVGMKGLPGQPGLGIGHRPKGAAWTADPEGAVLRDWLGADADVYLRDTQTPAEAV